MERRHRPRNPSGADLQLSRRERDSKSDDGFRNGNPNSPLISALPPSPGIFFQPNQLWDHLRESWWFGAFNGLIPVSSHADTSNRCISDHRYFLVFFKRLNNSSAEMFVGRPIDHNRPKTTTNG
ncbi:hypothetical protein CEXT_736371 [Caerostris extrusa]|uniref:Uncharacterized protein n=1 Tax=Caerostris extrusa TaxID=172846 RepID=A0AAV4NFJ8_CAEEX|nr:hypothetical protein CEXT_736371 [Caerostris extrusa]